MGLFSKNDKWKITKNIQMVVLKEFLRTVQKKKLEQQKKGCLWFLRLDGVKGSILESKEQYQRKHKKFWK